MAAEEAGSSDLVVPVVFQRLSLPHTRTSSDRLPAYRDLRTVPLRGSEKDFIAEEAYINCQFGLGVASGGVNFKLRIDPLPLETYSVGGPIACERVFGIPALISARYNLPITRLKNWAKNLREGRKNRDGAVAGRNAALDDVAIQKIKERIVLAEMDGKQPLDTPRMIELVGEQKLETLKRKRVDPDRCFFDETEAKAVGRHLVRKMIADLGWLRRGKAQDITPDSTYDM